MARILRAVLGRPSGKVLLVALIAACAAPFVLHDRNGRPLMSLDRLTAPALALPDLGAAETAYRRVRNALPLPAHDGGTTVVYRWRDEQGVWQFSDRNRADGAGEAVVVDGDANLVRFEGPAPAASPGPSAPPAPPASGPASLFPLADAPRLVHQARQVQGQLNQRHERQKDALGD